MLLNNPWKQTWLRFLTVTKLWIGENALSVEWYEENVIEVVHYSSCISARWIATYLVLHTTVWQMLNFRVLYHYHLQQIQHLEPGNLCRQLEYYRWLATHTCHHQYIVFIDETHFTCGGVNSTRNSHLWLDMNPDGMEANFNYCFTVSLWCDVFND
jgi:hypothetical protein